jgi:hypothetical protein
VNPHDALVEHVGQAPLWAKRFRALFFDPTGPNPIDPNTTVHHFESKNHSRLLSNIYNNFVLGLPTLDILVFLFFLKKKEKEINQKALNFFFRSFFILFFLFL